MIGPRIEEVGPFHAVVFDDWRMKLSDRRTGPIINPCGAALWVLCGSRDAAYLMHRRGQNTMGLSDHVTTARRETFAAALPMLPDGVAIAFSNGKDVDDDLHLSRMHPIPESLRSVYLWEKGRYRIESETIREGRLQTVPTTIGTGSIDSSEFSEKMAKALARLVRTAPAPYEDRHPELNVSEGVLAVLAHLGAPAAFRLRDWLDRVDAMPFRERKAALHLSSSSFAPDIGIRSVSIKAVGRSTRLRTTVTYDDGSTLTDHGFDHAGSIPDTMLCAVPGMPLDRVVDGLGILPWIVVDAVNRQSDAHFGFVCEGVPIGRPAGRAPLSIETAESRLRALFEMDLRPTQSRASVEMFQGTDEDRQMVLNASASTTYALSGLGPETIAYLIEETLPPDAETQIDLSAWLGEGAKMRRTFGTLSIEGEGRLDLADSILMPGRPSRQAQSAHINHHPRNDG